MGVCNFILKLLYFIAFQKITAVCNAHPHSMVYAKLEPGLNPRIYTSPSELIQPEYTKSSGDVQLDDEEYAEHYSASNRKSDVNPRISPSLSELIQPEYVKSSADFQLDDEKYANHDSVSSRNLPFFSEAKKIEDVFTQPVKVGNIAILSKVNVKKQQNVDTDYDDSFNDSFESRSYQGTTKDNEKLHDVVSSRQLHHHGSAAHLSMLPSNDANQSSNLPLKSEISNEPNQFSLDSRFLPFVSEVQDVFQQPVKLDNLAVLSKINDVDEAEYDYPESRFQQNSVSDVYKQPVKLGNLAVLSKVNANLQNNVDESLEEEEEEDYEDAKGVAQFQRLPHNSAKSLLRIEAEELSTPNKLNDNSLPVKSRLLSDIYEQPVDLGNLAILSKVNADMQKDVNNDEVPLKNNKNHARKLKKKSKHGKSGRSSSHKKIAQSKHSKQGRAHDRNRQTKKLKKGSHKKSKLRKPHRSNIKSREQYEHAKQNNFYEEEMAGETDSENSHIAEVTDEQDDSKNANSEFSQTHNTDSQHSREESAFNNNDKKYSKSKQKSSSVNNLHSDGQSIQQAKSRQTKKHQRKHKTEQVLVSEEFHKSDSESQYLSTDNYNEQAGIQHSHTELDNSRRPTIKSNKQRKYQHAQKQNSFHGKNVAGETESEYLHSSKAVETQAGLSFQDNSKNVHSDFSQTHNTNSQLSREDSAFNNNKQYSKSKQESSSMNNLYSDGQYIEQAESRQTEKHQRKHKMEQGSASEQFHQSDSKSQYLNADNYNEQAELQNSHTELGNFKRPNIKSKEQRKYQRVQKQNSFHETESADQTKSEYLHSSKATEAQIGISFHDNSKNVDSEFSQTHNGNSQLSREDSAFNDNKKYSKSKQKFSSIDNLHSDGQSRQQAKTRQTKKRQHKHKIEQGLASEQFHKSDSESQYLNADYYNEQAGLQNSHNQLGNSRRPTIKFSQQAQSQSAHGQENFNHDVVSKHVELDSVANNQHQLKISQSSHRASALENSRQTSIDQTHSQLAEQVLSKQNAKESQYNAENHASDLATEHFQAKANANLQNDELYSNYNQRAKSHTSQSALEHASHQSHHEQQNEQQFAQDMQSQSAHGYIVNAENDALRNNGKYMQSQLGQEQISSFKKSSELDKMFENSAATATNSQYERHDSVSRNHRQQEKSLNPQNVLVNSHMPVIQYIEQIKPQNAHQQSQAFAKNSEALQNSAVASIADTGTQFIDGQANDLEQNLKQGVAYEQSHSFVARPLNLKQNSQLEYPTPKAKSISHVQFSYVVESGNPLENNAKEIFKHSRDMAEKSHYLEEKSPSQHYTEQKKLLHQEQQASLHLQNSLQKSPVLYQIVDDLSGKLEPSNLKKLHQKSKSDDNSSLKVRTLPHNLLAIHTRTFPIESPERNLYRLSDFANLPIEAKSHSVQQRFDNFDAVDGDLLYDSNQLYPEVIELDYDYPQQRFGQASASDVYKQPVKLGNLAILSKVNANLQKNVDDSTEDEGDQSTSNEQDEEVPYNRISPSHVEDVYEQPVKLGNLAVLSKVNVNSKKHSSSAGRNEQIHRDIDESDYDDPELRFGQASASDVYEQPVKLGNLAILSKVNTNLEKNAGESTEDEGDQSTSNEQDEEVPYNRISPSHVEDVYEQPVKLGNLAVLSKVNVNSKKHSSSAGRNEQIHRDIDESDYDDPELRFGQASASDVYEQPVKLGNLAILSKVNTNLEKNAGESTEDEGDQSTSNEQDEEVPYNRISPSHVEDVYEQPVKLGNLAVLSKVNVNSKKHSSSAGRNEQIHRDIDESDYDDPELRFGQASASDVYEQPVKLGNLAILSKVNTNLEKNAGESTEDEGDQSTSNEQDEEVPYNRISPSHVEDVYEQPVKLGNLAVLSKVNVNSKKHSSSAGRNEQIHRDIDESDYDDPELRFGQASASDVYKQPVKLGNLAILSKLNTNLEKNTGESTEDEGDQSTSNEQDEEVPYNRISPSHVEDVYEQPVKLGNLAVLSKVNVNSKKHSSSAGRNEQIHRDIDESDYDDPELRFGQASASDMYKQPVKLGNLAILSKVNANLEKNAGESTEDEGDQSTSNEQDEEVPYNRISPSHVKDVYEQPVKLGNLAVLSKVNVNSKKHSSSAGRNEQIYPEIHESDYDDPELRFGQASASDVYKQPVKLGNLAILSKVNANLQKNVDDSTEDEQDQSTSNEQDDVVPYYRRSPSHVQDVYEQPVKLGNLAVLSKINADSKKQTTRASRNKHHSKPYKTHQRHPKKKLKKKQNRGEKQTHVQESSFEEEWKDEDAQNSQHLNQDRGSNRNRQTTDFQKRPHKKSQSSTSQGSNKQKQGSVFEEESEETESEHSQTSNTESEGSEENEISNRNTHHKKIKKISKNSKPNGFQSSEQIDSEEVEEENSLEEDLEYDTIQPRVLRDQTKTKIKGSKSEWYVNSGISNRQLAVQDNSGKVNVGSMSENHRVQAAPSPKEEDFHLQALLSPILKLFYKMQDIILPTTAGSYSQNSNSATVVKARLFPKNPETVKKNSSTSDIDSHNVQLRAVVVPLEKKENFHQSVKIRRLFNPENGDEESLEHISNFIPTIIRSENRNIPDLVKVKVLEEVKLRELHNSNPHKQTSLSGRLYGWPVRYSSHLDYIIEDRIAALRQFTYEFNRFVEDLSKFSLSFKSKSNIYGEVVRKSFLDFTNLRAFEKIVGDVEHLVQDFKRLVHNIVVDINAALHYISKQPSLRFKEVIRNISSGFISLFGQLPQLLVQSMDWKQLRELPRL